MKPRHRTFGAALVVLLVLAAAALFGGRRTEAQAIPAGQVPIFEVDRNWPKPLPNNWIMSAVVGVAADANDNIWMIHRPTFLTEDETAPECCTTAPPVLVFDQAGNLIKSWNGRGAGPWPASEHGIYIDPKGFVWLGGNGSQKGNNDTQIMKFTQDGKFLLQIGTHATTHGSNDTENLHNAAKMVVDDAANEVYVADGYLNRRVAVFDATSGKYKRHWGAYGNKPNDDDPCNPVRATVTKESYDPNKPCQNFGRGVHGITLSRDGLVYVADRPNNRVQVFRKDGTFLKEGWINRTGYGGGSAYDVALSTDPQQAFLYVVDGTGMKMYVLRRESMETVTTFGRAGRYPGQFHVPHSIATDSRGNLYVGETQQGKRLQRFVYKGLGAR